MGSKVMDSAEATVASQGGVLCCERNIIGAYTTLGL